MPCIHNMGTMTSCTALLAMAESIMKHIALPLDLPWDPGVFVSILFQVLCDHPIMTSIQVVVIALCEVALTHVSYLNANTETLECFH